MLYRLVPTLISEGKVFIAESPLFEITCGKEVRFAYNEKEKAEILAGFEGKKVTLQRSKGWARTSRNDVDHHHVSHVRRLIRVMPDDAEQTQIFFDLLLGDNLQGRKDFIADHGHEYMDMLDVS
jgi:DNA gyrase subunit B